MIVLDAEQGIVECRPRRRKVAIVGVYAIIHQPSGRAYVGSSCDVFRRWRNHTNDLVGGHHHSPALLDLWLNDGAAAFTFVVLEQCSKEVLQEREQNWLDSFEAPLNRNASVQWPSWVAEANRRRKGIPWSAKDPGAWRAKLSEAMSGKCHGPHTSEWGAKIGDANRRAWVDPETRRLRGRAISTAKKAAIAQRRVNGQPAYAKTAATAEAHQRLSEALRGHAVSAATRAKISMANTGSHRTEEQRAKMRGRHLTDATKAKISAAGRGRRLSDIQCAALRGRPSPGRGRPNLAALAAWAAPGYRERMSASMRLAGKRATVIANRSAAQRRIWNDPVVRARRVSGIKRSIDPRQRSEAAKKQWEDRRATPEALQAFRDKVRLGVTQWWASTDRTHDV